MMLIRSQDKKSLINFDGVAKLTIFEQAVTVEVKESDLPFGEYNATGKYEYEVIIHTDCIGDVIGKYASEEKAIKVLDMICERYQNSLYCDNMFDNAAQVQRPYIVVSNEVFQMPQDSEV